MEDIIVFKQPKGTCDYSGIEQRNRERLVNACINTFVLYNAEPMDTPSFELTDAITKGVNSETAKETFELIPEDDNTEQYTLRYDQTMPFARFAKQQKLKKMRRYQVGYVYRRDQPNMGAGRFRQFLQADYDNLGENQDVPSTDAETLIMLCDALDRMRLDSKYIVRVNCIELLTDVLRWCDISRDKFEGVCRCLDKIQKQKWKKVKQDLVGVGVSDESIDKLKQSIDLFGTTKKYYSATSPSFDMFTNNGMMSNDTKGYLNRLFKHLILIMDWNFVSSTIVLDLSLARGLDYYTGLLFEVEMCSKLGKKIGSVAAGGRYDGLCGEGTQTVGFSLGIDRLLKFAKSISKKDYAPKVWVVQICSDENTAAVEQTVYNYRLWVLQQLRINGISAGTEMRVDTGVGPQIRYVLKKEIPYIIFVGTTELGNQTVSLKCISTQTQNEMKIEDAIYRIKE